MLLQQEDPAALTSPEVATNLRHAIELDPQYADAYAMLGLSLMNSRTFPAEAESNLARAVALSPRNDLYRYNYAVALLNQQQIDKGEAMLNLVLHSSIQWSRKRPARCWRRSIRARAMSTAGRKRRT